MVYPTHRLDSVAAHELVPPLLQPARVPAVREPLRICMMVTYDLASPCGGVKHHAQQLAAALRRNGDEVTIVGPASGPVRDEYTKTFSGVVNVPANGSDNMLGILVRPWQVAKFFRQNHFDVIHVHEPLQPSLSYWATWFTRKTPHVATFHAYAEDESRAFGLARKFWGATLFPWFERAMAVSNPAAQYAGAAWKRALQIVPNGVPTDIFTPAPTRLMVDRNAPVRLLFVGRIGDRRKGAPYLFDAYKQLLARGLNVTLDVAGELGQAEPPPELPGLTYHGAVGFDRLVQLYRECDVFVAPSTGQESFGIVLLEAMSSAKPVVCSDIDGYRQVAVPEGSYLVPPADVAALADQLERVIKLGPIARMRQGELNRRAAMRYDWNHLAGRVRDEYLAAIAERAARTTGTVSRADLAQRA
jgi:phosphatidyl-myo-inositol alpha-mannosyltransferase